MSRMGRVDQRNIDRCSFALKREQRNQRKLTTRIILMTLFFYVAWLPYAISSLLMMSGVLIPYGLNDIAFLFAKSATISNPIMYIFLNKVVSNFYLVNYENYLHNAILICINFTVTSFYIMLFSRSKSQIKQPVNNQNNIQASRLKN